MGKRREQSGASRSDFEHGRIAGGDATQRVERGETELESFALVHAGATGALEERGGGVHEFLLITTGRPDQSGSVSGEIIAQIHLIGRVGAGDHGHRRGEVVVAQTLDGVADEF